MQMSEYLKWFTAERYKGDRNLENMQFLSFHIV